MDVLSEFSLNGKVAVVTGGSRETGGFGRHVVDALAEAGAKTYAASRNLEALEQMAQEHRDQGHDVTALQFDQGDEASILSLRDEVITRSGRVDVLVNNAVLYTMLENCFQSDASCFDLSMHVNATGLFVITRAFGDVMAEQGSGSIINLGSIHGMTGPNRARYRGTDVPFYYPDYFFHKGGVINFTRFIASYYGPQNVRCNCISPGGCLSPGMPEAFVSQYNDSTFLGRLANGRDIKGAIVFLASDASGYVTGINIPVDGGYTAM